jgi:hypothetical protein
MIQVAKQDVCPFEHKMEEPLFGQLSDQETVSRRNWWACSLCNAGLLVACAAIPYTLWTGDACRLVCTTTTTTKSKINKQLKQISPILPACLVLLVYLSLFGEKTSERDLGNQISAAPKLFGKTLYIYHPLGVNWNGVLGVTKKFDQIRVEVSTRTFTLTLLPSASCQVQLCQQP